MTLHPRPMSGVQPTKKDATVTATRGCGVLVLALLTSACASSPVVRQQCVSPDAQLANIMRSLETLRATRCTERCESLGLELERLALVCRDHPPTLMANAVVAYDNRRSDRAQQYLDRLLAMPRSDPDAAMLRARIAIEAGNLPYARHLLEQRIHLTPDHPGLHETYGAALYLSRRLPEAERELATASALGAPAWRVAYHLGLVKEAQGLFDEAARYYHQALQAEPGLASAQSRLAALRAGGVVRP